MALHVETARSGEALTLSDIVALYLHAFDTHDVARQYRYLRMLREVKDDGTCLPNCCARDARGTTRE